MTETPNPLGKVVFNGKTMDRKTAAALAIAERRLGYKLTVTQGGYNSGGVAASAGTHDRGGVVDLAPFDQENKVRVLRNLGFAAWYRPAIAGLWPAHIHAVMKGHQDLAPAAKDQVEDFKDGKDGLAGGRTDPNTYHPNVEDFNFAKAWRDDLLTTKIRGLKARIKRLQDKTSSAKQKLTYRKAKP